MMFTARASGFDSAAAFSMPPAAIFITQGSVTLQSAYVLVRPHRPGHVRHTVVQHLVYQVRRFAVRRRAGCLDAAPLIDRHIDDHRAGFHQLQILARNQPGCLGARDQHRADDQVRELQVFADRVAIAVETIDVRWRDVIEVPQPSMFTSNSAMFAPKPAAILAAFAPTTPPPRIKIFAGGHTRDTAEQDSRGPSAASRGTWPLLAHSCGRRLRSSASAAASGPRHR